MEEIVHTCHARKKRNTTRANLTLSIVLHAVAFIAMFFWASYEGILGNRMRELTNNGEVRGGDFYGVKDHASVTLIASRITYLDKIKDYYERASKAVEELRQKETPQP